MKTAVTFENLLKTYSRENQRSTKLYLKVIELVRKGMSREKISQILHIPSFYTYNWLVRRQVPAPIKATEALKKFGFSLPLHIAGNERFKLFLKTLSFIFGDGTLTPKFCTYLSGDKSDLKEIKKEFQRTFKLNGKIRKIQSNKIIISGRVTNGISYIFDVQGEASQILGRLLHTAGAPTGDKVLKPFLIPDWIMKGPKWVKKLFLEVILGNELEAPRLRKSGSHFAHVRFGMVKIRPYLSSHKRFLNQLRALLEEFDIKTSNVKSPAVKSKRKNGALSYHLYFRISEDKPNLYRFYKTFKLRYTARKQKIFDNTIKIIKKSLEKELKQINYCNLALKLRKSGLGSVRIAKILGGIPDSTIDSWFNTSRKPYYFERKTELERLLKP